MFILFIYIISQLSETVGKDNHRRDVPSFNDISDALINFFLIILQFIVFYNM